MKHSKDDQRIEFSKIVLGAVMITYFLAFAIGLRIVAENSEYLHVFYTFVGGTTGVAVSFYSWKAKNENVKKISQNIDIEGSEHEYNGNDEENSYRSGRNNRGL